MSRVLPDLFLLTPRHTGTRWIIRNLSKNTLALRQDARNHIHRAERWRPKLARFRKILMTVRHPIDYALAQMNDLSPIRLGVFTTVRHLHEERPELDTFVFRVDCDPEDREASREALQE